MKVSSVGKATCPILGQRLSIAVRACCLTAGFSSVSPAPGGLIPVDDIVFLALAFNSRRCCPKSIEPDRAQVNTRAGAAPASSSSELATKVRHVRASILSKLSVTSEHFLAHYGASTNGQCFPLSYTNFANIFLNIPIVSGVAGISLASSSIC